MSAVLVTAAPAATLLYTTDGEMLQNWSSGWEMEQRESEREKESVKTSSQPESIK